MQTMRSSESHVAHTTGTFVADSDEGLTGKVIRVNDTYKYSEFGFRIEEKFCVLPRRVKTHIENVLLNWLVKRPKTRLCLGNSLGLALTVLAHATHQMLMDWDVFVTARMDDDVLLRILRCYITCVPEPGTYMGEIVAQFFQHCRQQSNLNVKRKIGANVEEVDPAARHTGSRQIKAKRSEIDRKFEIVMSLKRVPLVTVVFRIALKRIAFTREEPLIDYLKKRVFGTLCHADGESFLSRFKHDFFVHPWDGTDNGDSDGGKEVYFSLDLFRKSKYDLLLDRVFESVYIYNSSLDAVDHRTGECNVVYCSDTVYFMELSKRLFVDNSITFIYCYLTGKHKPIVETKEDTDAFGMAKILSSVEHSTKNSMKRNHSSRLGHGPLSSVISEGGLNESAKFVNNKIREHILTASDDDSSVPLTADAESVDMTYYVPKSPTYSPTESPPARRDSDHSTCPREDTTELRSSPLPSADDGVDTTGGYAINEPYVNAFLNRPVECGNMY